MDVVLGTTDGVWRLRGESAERIGLAGLAVSHVADRDGVILAAVPRDGLYALDRVGVRRIWSGDARACAIGPDGTPYVGVEPAMIFRGDASGAHWTRCDAIDALPTRGEWYFPPPPHQPHVRSIDFLSDDSHAVLVGVEVGGVLLSPDRGATWREMNDGVHPDVHTVRPDPLDPAHWIACTGGGVYVSTDAGASWVHVREGLGQGYAVGLHLNPERAGEVLIATGQRPPGLEARVSHSTDGGHTWRTLADAALPTRYARVPVVLFGAGTAWIMTDAGEVFRAGTPAANWRLVAYLPAAITAASAGGSPCSVESGAR